MSFLPETAQPVVIPAANIPPDLVQRIATGLSVPGIGLGLIAPDDTIAYASPELSQLWHLKPGTTTFADVIRYCHRTGTGLVIATDDVEDWLRKANEKRRSVPLRAFEVDTHDGRWFWLTEVTFDDGWLMLTISDITRLKTSEHAMRQARDTAIYWSETDALTELSNRHCVMKRLADHAQEANIGGSALSIALLDIDHFKSINDSHGHDIGDKVLQHFAAAGGTAIRKSDLLARVGGEEFLLVLPGSDVGEAFTVVDRLRSEIADSWPIGHGALRYTFSAGVAQLRPGETSEQIYKRADQALYRAKKSGRNRVETDVNLNMERVA